MFDIKENEWTYNRQLIYQQIYIIKTKYIPSYIFENKGKIFKKLKKLAVFLRSEIVEVKRVFGKFTLFKY